VPGRAGQRGRLPGLRPRQRHDRDRRQPDLRPGPGEVAMATWDNVRRLALALPGTAERVSRGGLLAWDVKDKTFAWERPLRPADRKALGPAAPEGPVLAARVPDLGAKEALLAEAGDTWFTTPHFQGYPAILARLDRGTLARRGELPGAARRRRGATRLAKKYLDRP